MFSKACIAVFVAAAVVSASHEASPAKPTRPKPSQSLFAGELSIVESVLQTKLYSISPETTKVLDKREAVSPAVSALAQNEVFNPLLADANNVERVVVNETIIMLPSTTYTISGPSFTLVTPTPGPFVSSSTSTQTVTDYSNPTTVTETYPVEATVSILPGSTSTVTKIQTQTESHIRPYPVTTEKTIGMTFKTGVLYGSSTSSIGVYFSVGTVPVKGAAPLATGVGVAGLGAAALGAAVALL